MGGAGYIMPSGPMTKAGIIGGIIGGGAAASEAKGLSTGASGDRGSCTSGASDGRD